MKNKSNNKTVSSALNSTWVIIGIPFFTLMISVFVFGFYLLNILDVSGGYPLLVILAGILIPSLVCHQISKVWFSWQLDKVEDKIEFIERAKRLQMIWPSTADKIVNKKGIIVTNRNSQPKVRLPDIIFSDGLILTNDFIELKGQQYKWSEINDFRITATGYGGYIESNLMLIFNDNRFERENFTFKNGQEVEYQIDKYLNNNTNILI